MPADPTSRTLRLLSLLATGREWTASDLARAVDSTERTVRRDVARLRDLGYTVVNRPGPRSAYVLAAPASTPVLFDAEDVAVLVAALRASSGRIDAVAADRVTAKLESLVPALLRVRVGMIDRSTESVEPADAAVDAATLGAVAEAIAESGRLRFAYTDARERASDRTVDPERIVVGGDAWYLVAWDLDRDDWRLFRLDRIADPSRVSGVFSRRSPPYDSVAAWFATDFGRVSG